MQPLFQEAGYRLYLLYKDVHLDITCRDFWTMERILSLDRIDLFRIFVRVVEVSSFTRAADTLGIPRSSVSAAVQELEDRVGARLLHRTTRVVSATQDGVAFMNDARSSSRMSRRPKISSANPQLLRAGCGSMFQVASDG